MTTITKYGEGSVNKRQYVMGAGTTVSAIFSGTGEGGNINTYGGGSYSYGVWTHIAVSFVASTKTCQIYVNGDPVTTTLGTNTMTGSTIYTSDTPFSIGAWRQNDSTWRDWGDGLIDEARVWNTIRTAAEIKANYQKQLVGNESGLVGYWQLNNNYLDKTSNGNTLTAVNTPVFSTDFAPVDRVVTSAFML